MGRLRWNGQVAWAVAAALVALAVGLLTNLVTSESPSRWVMVGFVISALAAVVLTGRQAAVASRAGRAELLRRRAEVLAPILPPAAWEGGRPEVSALLDPRSRVAPFVGRTREVAQLRAWCAAPAGRRVRLVSGVSGVGKTRLAIEAAAGLGPEWAAGLAVPGRLGELVAAVAACGEPTLVAVDDADTATDVAVLLDQVRRYEGEPRIRVLLVVRDARAFTGWVGRHGGAHLVQTWDADAVTAVEPIGQDGDRRQWFVGAFNACAAAVGVAARVSRAGVGLCGVAGEPMMVTCVRAALAAVGGGSRALVDAVRTAGTDALAARLVEHEMSRWSTAAADPRAAVQVPGVTDDGRADVVLALVLSGATTRDTATAVLGRLPRLKGQLPGVLDSIVTWAISLYPAPPASAAGCGALVAPQPEFLAAALVAFCADPDPRAYPDRRARAHGTTVDRVGVRTAALQDNARIDNLALASLVRAAAWFPAAAGLAVNVLDRHPEAVAAAVEATALAGLRAARALDTHLARLVAAGPLNSEDVVRLLVVVGPGLGRIMVSLRQREVEAAQAATRENPTANNRAGLARSLTDLGDSLHRVGEYRKALTAAREAVALRRELARVEAGRYTGDLAESLTNLAASLREVGEYRKALTAAREAVALRRELARVEPGRYTGDLAESLTNLAASLWNVGEYRKALTAAREAVALYRELATVEPGRYTADFARSLNPLGVSLQEVGEYREALTVTREAVALYRELATVEPGRSTGYFARSLINLGVSLQEVGEYREALTVTREAVALYRELATAEPGRYTGELAHSLNSLGASLREVGEYREALTATREAVALRRELARVEPGRYTGDLAHSLSNLGASLQDLGEYREALTATREAVTLRRELARIEPGRYTGWLAGSLTNLGIILQATGEYRKALTATREAVMLRRELAAAEPGRYTGELVDSLNSLGLRLRHVGAQDEALAAEAEAVAWCGRLNRLRPGEFTTRYRAAHSDLARRVAEAGAPPDAVYLAEQDAAKKLPVNDKTP